MNSAHEHYQSYSWHQSHDQATLLLLVPYETVEEDVNVRIERHLIVAGVRGQPPLLKGRLYGTVDVPNSSWQLEPHHSRLSARERTLSGTSTASTQSSFAVVTDPEISSSFAASLENGLASDTDELDFSSPALSSPVSSSAEENHHFPSVGSSTSRRRNRYTYHPASPRHAGPSASVASSYSSVESLHTGATRLLTLHLEKAESMIWPSLVVGPVPEALSPTDISLYPWEASPTTEAKYNMDPTSLVLIGLDLSDIRENKSEAFEYFVRAWHQAHVPSATVRLAAHYLPLTTPLPELGGSPSTTPSASPCPTPTSSQLSSPPPISERVSTRAAYGTPAYYLHYVGGPAYLAQLYLETGLLYLEGTATSLLSSSYAGLSSLRASIPPLQSHSSDGLHGTEAWRRDRDTARRHFERARTLDPSLDVPLLPSPSETENGSEPEGSRGGGRSRTDSGKQQKLRMPAIEIGSDDNVDPDREVRRRHTKKDDASDANASSTSLVEKRTMPEDDDNTWYLYLPGLVGAGTALLVVGFLSFSSWRKGQGS